MEQKTKTRRGILTMLIAVLTAAALITFPYAFDLTWAMPGADSDRTLTYRPGSLTWDSAAEADENGVIRLSMFRSDYDNVSAAADENVTAPGVENAARVRLLNAAGGSIRYTAVLYRLDETAVPVLADLSGADAGQTDAYSLPAGVTEDQVLRAVGGTIGASSVTTLDVDWLWEYFIDHKTDRSDTALGNKAELDEVEYGLYIVVEDDNYSDVIAPKTGDNSRMMLWFVLAIVSLCVLIFLAVRDRRGEKARNANEHES